MVKEEMDIKNLILKVIGNKSMQINTNISEIYKKS